MKGLLLKDFYLSRQYARSGLCVWIVAFLFCLGMKNNTYGITMTMIFDMTIMIGIMAADGRGGWASFLTSPVSRDQMVTERYLYCLLMQLLLLAAGILPGIPATLVWHLSWEDMGFMVLVNLCYGFYLAAVTLPLCYKVRTEMMQAVVMVVLLIPFALVILAAAFWLDDQHAAIDYALAYRIGGAAAAVLILLWAGSFFLSRRLFRERDIS